MLLFSKKKKRKCAGQKGVAYATQDGTVLSVEEMPDAVFSSKVLGDGVCLIPEDGCVYSPVSGVVESAAETGHAFGITAEDGGEIMVHIGVDTVELQGKGFAPKVSAGQRVSAGELLCEVNLSAVQSSGHPIHTAVILTNADEFALSKIQCGRAYAGESELFAYSRSQ